MSNKLLLFLILAIVWGACEKDGYNYDKYLDGKEIVYPGKVSNLSAQPGYLREQISWTPSSDRSITQYVIYYNNRKDSIVVKATGETTADTMQAVVPDLKEYVQDFTIYTLDSAGNRSIGQTLTAVKVYGIVFQSALKNRQASFGGYDQNGRLMLNLIAAEDTINVATRITYKNAQNSTVNQLIGPEEQTAILTEWIPGHDVLICSGYFPQRNAIDTFWVTYADTLKGSDIPVQ